MWFHGILYTTWNIRTQHEIFVHNMKYLYTTGCSWNNSRWQLQVGFHRSYALQKRAQSKNTTKDSVTTSTLCLTVFVWVLPHKNIASMTPQLPWNPHRTQLQSAVNLLPYLSFTCSSVMMLIGHLWVRCLLDVCITGHSQRWVNKAHGKGQKMQCRWYTVSAALLSRLW